MAKSSFDDEYLDPEQYSELYETAAGTLDFYTASNRYYADDRYCHPEYFLTEEEEY